MMGIIGGCDRPADSQTEENSQPVPAGEKHQSSSTFQAPEPPAVARVNGEPILESELDAALQSALSLGDSVGTPETLRTRLLQELINARIFAQQADELGLDAEIERTVSRQLAAERGEHANADAFARYLRSRGQTPESHARQLRAGITRRLVLSALEDRETDISDDDVQEHYLANPDDYMEPAEWNLRTVRLRLNDVGQDRRAAARQAMQEIREILSTSGSLSAFSRAAAEITRQWPMITYSDSMLAPAQFSPDQQLAVGSLSPGEVSEVIETSQTLTLVRVLSSRPSRPRPLEEVAPSIRKRLILTGSRDRPRRIERQLLDSADVVVDGPADQ